MAIEGTDQNKRRHGEDVNRVSRGVAQRRPRALLGRGDSHAPRLRCTCGSILATRRPPVMTCSVRSARSIATGARGRGSTRRQRHAR